MGIKFFELAKAINSSNAFNGSLGAAQNMWRHATELFAHSSTGQAPVEGSESHLDLLIVGCIMVVAVGVLYCCLSRRDCVTYPPPRNEIVGVGW